VVEIGCSPGVLLAELATRGYKCVGVEPDEQTAAWVREKTGVDVRAGLFPAVDLPKCDVCLALDVLEHVLEPEAFMKGVQSLLNPGGIAIIQTPIDRYHKQPPFKNRFSVFDDIEHLFIYTDKSMQELARRAGLEVVNMNEHFRMIHEVCVLRKP
jgi:2-polyprenyl-3-methyl-5-hydroxy-6-metoxy-1,4-benzoquinol methylase